LFGIRHLTFGNRYSVFGVRYSAFGIQRSAFDILRVLGHVLSLVRLSISGSFIWELPGAESDRHSFPPRPFTRPRRVWTAFDFENEDEHDDEHELNTLLKADRLRFRRIHPIAR